MRALGNTLGKSRVMNWNYITVKETSACQERTSGEVGIATYTKRLN